MTTVLTEHVPIFVADTALGGIWRCSCGAKEEWQCPDTRTWCPETLRLISEARHYSHAKPVYEDENGRTRRSAMKRREQTPCGTPAGFAKHKRLHEPICPPCRAAESARQRKYA